jgi:hypothetical protein
MGAPLLQPSAVGASRSEPLVLAPESVEAVARLVVELLREEGVPTLAGGLVSATELALRLGVDRSWVYEHAAELGARRLGGGRKPRLRFDLAEAEAAIGCVAGRESPASQDRIVEPKRRPRRRPSAGAAADLLPIRGRSAA